MRGRGRDTGWGDVVKRPQAPPVQVRREDVVDEIKLSAGEEEEEKEDFDWKCHLLEIFQQYPEVYDLAHLRTPCKDCELHNIAW